MLKNIILLLAFLSLAVFCLLVIIHSIRTGTIESNTIVYGKRIHYRDREPTFYWSLVFLHLLGGLLGFWESWLLILNKSHF